MGKCNNSATTLWMAEVAEIGLRTTQTATNYSTIAYLTINNPILINRTLIHPTLTNHTRINHTLPTLLLEYGSCVKVEVAVLGSPS